MKLNTKPALITTRSRWIKPVFCQFIVALGIIATGYLFNLIRF